MHTYHFLSHITENFETAKQLAPILIPLCVSMYLIELLYMAVVLKYHYSFNLFLSFSLVTLNGKILEQANHKFKDLRGG